MSLKSILKAHPSYGPVLDAMEKHTRDTAGVSRYGLFNQDTGAILKSVNYICHAQLYYWKENHLYDRRESGKANNVAYFTVANSLKWFYNGTTITEETHRRYISFLMDRENGPFPYCVDNCLYTDIDDVMKFGVIMPNIAELRWDDVFIFSVALRWPWEHRDQFAMFAPLIDEHGATPLEAVLIMTQWKWDVTGEELIPRMANGHDFIADVNPHSRRWLHRMPNPRQDLMAAPRDYGRQAWDMWKDLDDAKTRRDNEPSGTPEQIIEWLRKEFKDPPKEGK